MTAISSPPHPGRPHSPAAGTSRRSFLGFVLAGTTLAVAVDLSAGASPASAAIPSPPSVPELYDLEDLETFSALPTSSLITISLDPQGVAHFAIPRAEVG